MLLCLAAPAGAAVLEWEDLPARAAASPRLAAEEPRQAAERARLGALARSWQPELGGFGGWSAAGDASASASSAEAGIEARLNLWRGGLDAEAEALGRARLEEAQARRSLALAELLLEAREAWLEAWSWEGRSQAIRRAQALAEEDRLLAERKAASGLTTQSEALEQKLRASKLDHHAHVAEQARDLAAARLAGLLGLDEARLPEGADLGWPAASSPTASRPGPLEILTRAAHKRALSEAEAAPAWPKPSLDLEGAWSREARRLPLEEPRLWGGLRLSLSLWDRGSSGREAHALTLLSQAGAFEAEAARALEAALRRAYASDVERWVSHRPHLEERLELARDLRLKLVGEYRQGIRDGRDLEASGMNLLEVEEELAEDRAVAWRSWARLSSK